MPNADRTSWKLVIRGVSLQAAADVLRTSIWRDAWRNYLAATETSVTTLRRRKEIWTASLPITDIGSLCAALRCAEQLHPKNGIHLCGSSTFGALGVDYYLGDSVGCRTECVAAGAVTQSAALRARAELIEQLLCEMSSLRVDTGKSGAVQG